jgi:hypothetical protein
MAAAMNVALGLAELPIVQSLHRPREQPAASFCSIVQLRGDDPHPAGKELIREVAKLSS